MTCHISALTLVVMETEASHEAEVDGKARAAQDHWIPLLLVLLAQRPIQVRQQDSRSQEKKHADQGVVSRRIGTGEQK